MTSAPTTTASGIGSRGFIQGLLSGLIPLALLIGSLLITLTATAAARALVAGADFATQQLALPLVFGVGLLATAVVYSVVTVRAVRRLRRWQAEGDSGRAAGSLWALGVTSVLIVLPVVLAFVLPQSPAVAK
jgi:hypothetical protein